MGDALKRFKDFQINFNMLGVVRAGCFHGEVQWIQFVDSRHKKTCGHFLLACFRLGCRRCFHDCELGRAFSGGEVWRDHLFSREVVFWFPTPDEELASIGTWFVISNRIHVGFRRDCESGKGLHPVHDQSS